MKNLLSFVLIAVLAAVIPLNAYAKLVDQSPSSKTVIAYGDWMYERINNDTQCELDEYVGEGGEVICPRFFGDSLVVQIGDYCFANNTNVKRVITSSPMWTVDEYAFVNCTSIESFECNYALREIKSGAFSGTSSLKKINLEDSVVTEIGAFAFLNSGIGYVTLPSTCTAINEYAFGQCKNLRLITIPDSVTSIDEKAFSGTNAVIACNPGSYAATFAAEKGIATISPDAEIPVGDADGNGDVNVNDATVIQRNCVGLDAPLSAYAMLCADVNRSGDVTIRDATLIQMKIADYDVGF